MNRFAELVESLAQTRDAVARLVHLRDYLDAADAQERDCALALLTGSRRVPRIKKDVLDAIVTARCDSVLWALSHDYVGDFGEALALAWPAIPGANRSPGLADLADAPPLTAERLTAWLDALDERGRWLLIKLLTGGLRLSAHKMLAEAAMGQAPPEIPAGDPAEIDLVLLYARPGTGRFIEITLGAWCEGTLVPVGKAGARGAILDALGPFLRDQVNERFGPVLALKPTLVATIRYCGIDRSRRYKAGLNLRDAQILGLNWDKPAAEAAALLSISSVCEGE